MKLRFFTALSALSTLALLPLALPAREAHACGGCFVQQQDATVVTGHRMVLSVSPTQSVLWDQIKYAGDPAEFAWVLPVREGAVIEVANDAWFDTLDAATTTRVLSPQVSCATSGGGFGCSSALAGASDRGLNSEGGVTVVHQGTVGPYETVTLKTDKPGALNAWLEAHGFQVDDGTQPVIDAYVKDAFEFIAIRLQPGKGVAQMKPVRVLTEGASPVLPLRMVAAGTGPQVSMVLFTISEARFAPGNFGEAVVPPALISWDFGSQSSNYAELRNAALSLDGGKVWLTAYAEPRTLLAPFNSAALGFPVQYGTATSSVDTIAAAYLESAMESGALAGDLACRDTFAKVALSAAVVQNPCPFGAKSDDPACASVSADAIDSRSLACGEIDDLAVALRGLHPRDVWLTRLEAQLPRAALGTDLDLVPANQQLPIDNWIRATRTSGEACPSGIIATLGKSAGGTTPKRGDLVGLGLAALALAAMARRLAKGTPEPVRAR